MTLLNWIFIGVAALLTFMGLAPLFHLRWVRRLPALAGGQWRGRRPRCSVVVAARDERRRIEQTVGHLLAQQDVEMEVIVVDDRSSDGTGDILKRLSADDPRLQLKRVDVLPSGWLGKCHACHLGATAATGEWLLFTDADCWLGPDVVARAIALAQEQGVDHVALTPGLAAHTLETQAWHLAFLITVANWMSGVNRNRPRAYFGLGAFNLVLAAAYRECGGYPALRLTVLDDVKLGLLLRRAGKRTRAFLGGADVECHWGTTLGDMIGVLEKNYFAAVDFRSGMALAGAGAGLLLLCTSIGGLFAGTVPGLAAALAPASFIAPGWVLATRLGWSWRAAALTPLIFPVLLYAMVNSACVTLWHGGIRWRETFYPIETLRKGTLR